MSNFDSFLTKHKIKPMEDIFISSVDDISLRVDKLERELSILPVDEIEIIDDSNEEDKDAR